jgi:hypothetical protein
MDGLGDTPPPGYKLETGDSGELLIEYRTTGMGCFGLFMFVWLSGWTIGCLVFTGAALCDPNGVDWALLLFMLPFWAVFFGMVAYVAWFFWSVTRFTFGADELAVERTLMGILRRRTFPRQNVKSIKQVKDGGEDDSFHCWGLVVIGEAGVFVLSQQPKDKSDWLGPLIAKWAGVAFVPYEPPAKEKYESL